jgi:hypothetical protein
LRGAARAKGEGRCGHARGAAVFPGRAAFSGDLKPIIGQYDRIVVMDMESPLASAKLSDEPAC